MPPELVDLLASRAADLALERLARVEAESPYLGVREAASYVRAKPQRIYDLLSARRLTRYKDGRRVLVSRVELDAYLAGSGPSRIAPVLPQPPQTRSQKGLAG